MPLSPWFRGRRGISRLRDQLDRFMHRRDGAQPGATGGCRLGSVPGFVALRRHGRWLGGLEEYEGVGGVLLPQGVGLVRGGLEEGGGRGGVDG